MQNQNTGYYRRLVVTHEAFPFLQEAQEISIGYDSFEGGTAGEFAIRWHKIGSGIQSRAADLFRGDDFGSGDGVQGAGERAARKRLSSYAQSGEIMSIAAEVSREVLKLARGRVWCAVCNRSNSVDSEVCLRRGWPKCCGYTMTLDSPEERES